MQELIKKDILEVLEELIGILGQKNTNDVVKINDLSNKVLKKSSVFQDEDSISVAILIYALSKIIQREQQLDYKAVISNLKSGTINLKQGNDKNFRKYVRKIFDQIRASDKKLKLYIYEVINQARIKKGCVLCETGLSVGRASEIIGISQWELMHYLGKTTLVDQYSEHVNVARRLKFTRGLFS